MLACTPVDISDNEDNNRWEEQPKPREVYEPPEPSNEEEFVFSSGISSGINFDKYDRIHVRVTGDTVVPPCTGFEDCGLREIVLQNVKKSNYRKPTPVQKNAMPIIMAGRDLMACAQTGSGKTAAFLLPIINVLLSDPRNLIISDCIEPQAVIVSPTRELTLQIYHEARKFAHSSFVKVLVAYGGTSVSYQASQIARGCHILVATAGRLNDFVNRGRVNFSSVRFFVLDEADRMLDMGFLPAIEQMLDHPTMVPSTERQTLMFSATFPEDIQTLAGRYLNNYLFLVVGIVGGACADVEQSFYEVEKYEKRNKLIEILEDTNPRELTLVFVETKRNADFLAAFLSENNCPTTSIHGDRLQSQREQALADFKSGRMPTLVATAVAARGLDIKNVSHVINYDLPSTIDEYVHRIGRTGRVGNRGKATSFYDSGRDSQLAPDLVKILQQVCPGDIAFRALEEVVEIAREIHQTVRWRRKSEKKNLQKYLLKT
ncbi:hypothetical protein AAG570_006193 [Ranatra chinensis]|uniref:RNA helicase n=1 Tax=Ranatra chinensis TaxID=642074 RepID=A0ABD0YJ24_9HEMI